MNLDMEWKSLARLTRATRKENAARSRCDVSHASARLFDQMEYGEYERPAIHVIGRVRDLTGGSSSSGRKDANSQYYW